MIVIRQLRHAGRTCPTPLTFIALLTDPDPIAHTLALIAEPGSIPDDSFDETWDA